MRKGQSRSQMLPSVFPVPCLTASSSFRPSTSQRTVCIRHIKVWQRNIKHVSEIQIDCDYTLKSRKNYYEFLKEVKQAWGQTLSTTIRLHQLSMEAPPVDYGVLMIYNTGDPRKWEERNPILDIRDVQPYLKRLDSYPLPLAAAYPVYQWVRMIRNIRIEHTVGADEILRVKEAVEKERSSLKNVIVTYHLDKDNINRYKPETYEEIYHH